MRVACGLPLPFAPSLSLFLPLHFHCSMLSAFLWSPESHVVAALHNLKLTLKVFWCPLVRTFGFSPPVSSLPPSPTFLYLFLFSSSFSLLLSVLLPYSCYCPSTAYHTCLLLFATGHARYALSLRALHTASVAIINSTHTNTHAFINEFRFSSNVAELSSNHNKQRKTAN